MNSVNMALGVEVQPQGSGLLRWAKVQDMSGAEGDVSNCIILLSVFSFHGYSGYSDAKPRDRNLENFLSFRYSLLYIFIPLQLFIHAQNMERTVRSGLLLHTAVPLKSHFLCLPFLRD